MPGNEYILSVNRFKQPEKVKGKQAIGLLLLRLILLEPGTNPLHPDEGVGIRRWRYSMGTLEDLRKRTQKQIETYLPEISGAVVTIVTCPDYTCNIEIRVGDEVYVYESATGAEPITLSEIAEGNSV